MKRDVFWLPWNLFDAEKFHCVHVASMCSLEDMLHIIALAHSRLSFLWNVCAFHCIILEKIEMGNTIQICYCYFNLQSLCVHTRTLCTDFYFISFCSYSICFFLNVFVIVVMCMFWLILSEKKGAKQFHALHDQVKQTQQLEAFMLYVLYVRLQITLSFSKQTTWSIQCCLHLYTFRLVFHLKIH